MLSQPSGLARIAINEEGAMPKIPPFHTTSLEYTPHHRNVHHDNALCKDGQRIELKHRRPGKEGRPLCDECKRLDREGR